MKHTKNFLCFLLLSSFGISTLHGQATNPASGGDASGTGGSVSYSVGQVVYTINTGTNGTVYQGVQQPYEISIVTAIRNTEEIILECLVFPNPTSGLLKLIINPFDHENLRYRLYDLTGMLLQDKKIDSEETEILMNSLSPSTYFLKVLSVNKEIKTFKIIKN
ncbi:MAG: T9SS type A sorting domain-containing protein [Bacteroidales bacterium]|nr:T9SS type A sorting domain-containing protein [Bacteroidales bacterium]